MADQDAPAFTPVRIAARDIPPPSTISEAARQSLSQGAAMPRRPRPSPDDTEAWHRQSAAVDAMWEKQGEPIFAKANATLETVELGGVTCYDCAPINGAAADGPVYLFIHGGAFVVGGGPYAKALGYRNAGDMGLHCISVDYRMPPDHPFPAAPEDCVAVYKTLMETVDPGRIVIGGLSAGANLAAAAALMIRDRSLPAPAGTALLSPMSDLTEAGDSFRTNEDLDVILKAGLTECNLLYAGGHDLTDPYLSPNFADFTKGFPPTLIQSGTRDLFLSNSVRLHRKLRDAGIEAELHVWEAMPHGEFMGSAPENDEVIAEVAQFIRRVAGR